jgi:hypothetical protein
VRALAQQVGHLPPGKGGQQGQGHDELPLTRG